MVRSKHLAALVLALVGTGCGDDDAPPEEVRETDDSLTGAETTMEPGTTTSITDTDTDSDGVAMSFLVTIENLSNRTALPTPLSPGVFAVHGGDIQLFTEGDGASPGLERLAEDGDPRRLADDLRGEDGVFESGVFDTSRNTGTAGPALPGDAYEFVVMRGDDEAPRLSFALMIAQTNDIFLATPPEGIPLVDENGQTIESSDITSRLMLWDAGTEANEAPGMGRNQLPRQEGPESGAAEMGVYPFTHETRALPLANGIADVTVEEAGGEYTITIENVSVERGAIATPLSPVFWAVHDGAFMLFDPAGPARDGLEALAEDGNPSPMVEAHRNAAGVLATGMENTPMGAGMPRPAEPGERFVIAVRPDEQFQWLSFATMVVETNDAFLAMPPQGVALIDEFGNPRDAATVEADIRRELAAWDAGTEENEVPGVGANQAPRQAAPNTGPEQSGAGVQRYADFASDLSGSMLGGFMDVRIVGMEDGSFQVTVRNTSDQTGYPGMLSPLMWMLHNSSIPLFRLEEDATPGLEALAEAGDPTVLLQEMTDANGVMMTGTVSVPDGATEPRPLEPGEAYVFTVTPEGSDRLFSFASMVVPSNDTFAAFSDGGIALLNDAGAPRSDGDIAEDVAIMLRAWDAGTEANQAGAAGPDQAPRQSRRNVGAPQGDETIRPLASDRVWAYPRLQDSIRVTIHPR